MDWRPWFSCCCRGGAGIVGARSGGHKPPVMQRRKAILTPRTALRRQHWDLVAAIA